MMIRSFLSKLSLTQSWSWFRRTSRILWVRVALISVLSIAAALSATFLDPLIPDGWRNRFSAEATLPVLNILASSMLAVATFSLGIMVSSHSSLSGQSTPRIHQLLIEDTSTQSVIATFIGAFVFALSAIILFRAGYYDENAAVIVFLITVLVVVTIVVSLVRWIGRLSRISSLDYALDRAEESAAEVLSNWCDWPQYGAVTLTDDVDTSARQTISAHRSGHVLRIAFDELQDHAESEKAELVIDIRPGDHVLEGQVVARSTAGDFSDVCASAIEIGNTRSYDQDPRYALRALRESAQRALSPGINDPGTAIDVVKRLERLLWKSAGREDNKDVVFDRLHLEPLTMASLIDLAFLDAARDGAATYEVMAEIRRAVEALAKRCDGLDPLIEAIDAYAKAGLSEAEFETRYRGS